MKSSFDNCLCKTEDNDWSPKIYFLGAKQASVQSNSIDRIKNLKNSSTISVHIFQCQLILLLFAQYLAPSKSQYYSQTSV